MTTITEDLQFWESTITDDSNWIFINEEDAMTILNRIHNNVEGIVIESWIGHELIISTPNETFYFTIYDHPSVDESEYVA